MLALVEIVLHYFFVIQSLLHTAEKNIVELSNVFLLADLNGLPCVVGD